jgi:hypothetical protein
MDYDFRQILLPPLVAFCSPEIGQTYKCIASARGFLSGRPGHRAPSKQVYVQVVNALPTI